MPIGYGSYADVQLRALSEACEGLAEVAGLAARAARRSYKLRTRQSRGGTLRPGTETPLWNALAAAARRRTGKWGAKANLGRHLHLPRQRIHEYLKSGTAAPDAERTLELLLWIGRTRSVHRADPAGSDRVTSRNA